MLHESGGQGLRANRHRGGIRKRLVIFGRDEIPDRLAADVRKHRILIRIRAVLRTCIAHACACRARIAQDDGNPVSLAVVDFRVVDRVTAKAVYVAAANRHGRLDGPHAVGDLLRRIVVSVVVQRGMRRVGSRFRGLVARIRRRHARRQVREHDLLRIGGVRQRLRVVPTNG